MNIISIFAITFQITIIGNWTQSDWSGGNGQLFWGDTTMYWSKSNIADSLVQGKLSLFTEDTSKSTPLSPATKVWCIIKGGADTIFVSTESDGVDIFYSIDDGNTWQDCYKFIWAGEDLIEMTPSLCWTTDTLIAGGSAIPHNKCYIFPVTNFGDSGFSTYQQFAGDPLFIYSLIAVSSEIMLGGTGNKSNIIRSINRGHNWTKISMPDDRIICLLNGSDGNIYAGTGDNLGLILKSLDSGATWVDTFDLDAKSIYSLVETPDSTIYASTDTIGKVFKSTDYGGSWDTTAVLPGVIEARALACDSSGIIYVGTACSDDSARIFYSADEGNTWENALESSVCYGKILSLLLTHNGDILAGTDYNGTIFKFIKYDTPGWLISSVYNTGTNNKSVQYDTISWEANYNEQDIKVKVRTFDTTGGVWDTTSWDSCEIAINGSDISELLSVRDSAQFVQYSVEFSTNNPFISPVFHEIKIGYSLDTLSPSIESSIAYGDEEFIPPDSIIPNDKVIISLNESVVPISVDASNIDSLLKLSNEHLWIDSFSNISSAFWDSTCKILTITLGKDGWSKWVNAEDTIYPSVYQNDSIADKWGNLCTSPYVITGSFGPVIDSIVAYEGIDSVEYIDDDDYVTFYFSKRTNKPRIDKNNIDSILRVPGHTWLNGFGEIRGDSCIWDSLGFALTCSLKIDSLRPTIAVGDTVYSDSTTIWDKFERGVLVSPCIISGSFGEYGPVMISAIAYEGWPDEVGLGDGDYIEIFFNKLVDTIPWSSLDIDTVLIAQANGDTHTWHPESFSCYVQQLEQQNAQGIPYTILYISLKVGIEEHDTEFTIQSSRLESYPNPFSKVIWIKYQIPGDRRQKTEDRVQELKLSTLNSQQLSPVAVGDTIYPNPNVIKDLKKHSAIKPVVLQGEFKKSPAMTHDSRLTTLNSQLLTLNNSKFSTSRVSLRIYNLAGQLVRTLVDEQKIPGEYKVQWDGLNKQGKRVKSGIYFYKLTIDGHILTKKLTLLR